MPKWHKKSQGGQNMKTGRMLLLLMVLVLIAGCGKKQPDETTPIENTQTAEATEATAPELVYGTAQVNGVPAVLATMSRGNTVDVVGAFDEKHYAVKLDAGFGLVEKNLVRLEGEPEFEPWTGYAYQNAQVYNNYRLSGAPVKKLTADAPVQILEDLGWCYLVEQDGAVGYMKHESLAKKPAGNRDNSGTSSSEKSRDGSVGQDGGEISLQVSGGVTLLSTLVPQEGTVSGKGYILADETHIVLGYFDRGDQIPLIRQSEAEETLTVYLDGLYAEVSGNYVRTEGEDEYASWAGRSRSIATVYSDMWMLGSPCDRVNANTAVTVLYELEDCYLVEVNGMMGYMAKDDILPAETEKTGETTPVETKPEKTDKPTTPVKPTKPAEPEETTAPTEESKPTEPAKPEETEKPTVPQDNNTGNADPEWTPPIL